MGASQSAPSLDYYNVARLLSLPDLIVPELLVAELSETERPNDYLGRAMDVLGQHITKEIVQFSEADAISFDDVSLLLEPGPAIMEHGFIRRRDGSLYIAIHTDLGRIDGELFDWWFRQCDNDDKFRWWHPRSHGACTFDAPFFAAMPWERRAGHYVGHIQVVEEVINGQKLKLHYEYVRPSRFFDANTFAEHGVTACIVARIHLSDPKWGLIAVGHVVHMVREMGDGTSELRSRYWIGDILFAETPENYYYAQVLDAVSNTWVARSVQLSTGLAQGLAQQVAEKMACLKSFLPDYRKHVQTEQEAFQSHFDFKR